MRIVKLELDTASRSNTDTKDVFNVTCKTQSKLRYVDDVLKDVCDDKNDIVDDLIKAVCGDKNTQFT